VPEECPPAVERLMQRCLEYDPAERPTAKEVVEALRRALAARCSEYIIDLLSRTRTL